MNSPKIQTQRNLFVKMIFTNFRNGHHSFMTDQNSLKWRRAEAISHSPSNQSITTSDLIIEYNIKDLYDQYLQAKQADLTIQRQILSAYRERNRVLEVLNSIHTLIQKNDTTLPISEQIEAILHQQTDDFQLITY